MERYSIYEGRMEDLMKKITRIQNKCKKFGCGFHFEQVGEELKEVKCPDGTVQKFRFILVEAEGTAKVNDWEFVASVEHTSKGNIFSKAMTDVEIPERYRCSDPYCEHCNVHRSRKDTFIIKNMVTGDFKQVGKSCLMDFTHGMSAEAASLYASMHDVFEEAVEAPVSFGGWHVCFFDTKDILLYAAETIRHFGYAKTVDAWGNWNPDSTKDKMTRFFEVGTGRTRFMHKDLIREIQDEMDKVGFNADSAEAHKAVDDALAWIEGQEASNDYMHNLKVVTSLEAVDYSKFGLLVSLFPTYNRELAWKAEQAEKEAKRKAERKSQWMGEVGQRITIDVESVACVTSWTNCFDGYNTSVTYLYKIVDTKGNVYMWKTAKDLDNVSKLIGTVKEYDEFRGVKQTVLTRCKVLSAA